MSNKKAWSSFKTGFCKRDKLVVNRETKKIEKADEFWYYFGDGFRRGIKIYAGITIGAYALVGFCTNYMYKRDWIVMESDGKWVGKSGTYEVKLISDGKTE